MPVMNEDQVSAAGAALFAAERDRSQTRLISAAHPGMDMDDAYAVQAISSPASWRQAAVSAAGRSG
ncbi:MAG: hypothetical protein CM15mP115_04720 [Alphaproteobacteria bacterium]|nr:MAG: hypothetical protein CM15mP115_04720 [Alphaproteobacteria bacterium]